MSMSFTQDALRGSSGKPASTDFAHSFMCHMRNYSWSPPDTLKVTKVYHSTVSLPKFWVRIQRKPGRGAIREVPLGWQILSGARLVGLWAERSESSYRTQGEKHSCTEGEAASFHRPVSGMCKKAVDRDGNYLLCSKREMHSPVLAEEGRSELKDRERESPVWCGSVDWVLACEPKGRWFNSQSGHMPGLRARPPLGGVQEATTHWYFSPSLPISLKISKILKRERGRERTRMKMYSYHFHF